MQSPGMLRVIFLLSVMCLSALVQGQNSPVTSPVVIVTAGPPGADELGAGFITGELNGRLYIVTAHHVVGDFPNMIWVKLAGYPQKVAATLDRPEPELDLAILSIRKPSDYSPPPSFAWAQQLPNLSDEVVVIGHPNGAQWDVNRVVRLKATNVAGDYFNTQLTLYDNGLDNGNSGGVVLSQDHKLIAMVQEVSGSQVTCLRASVILSVLAENGYPDDLMIGIPTQIAPSIDPSCSRNIQRGNTYFSARQWTEARAAFQRAQQNCPDEELSNKIATCDREIRLDQEYLRLRNLGLQSGTLEEALDYYEQAQTKRNRPEIQQYIRETREDIARLKPSPVSPVQSTPTSRSSYTDRYAGDMVWVEGGSFMMGSKMLRGEKDERPIHKVSLDGFWMGKYEVTNEQFCVFLNEKGNQTEGGVTWLDIESSFCDITQSGSQFLPKSGKNNHPVRVVSWYGAKAYTAWMATKTGHNYHLPTEAQWEYAAGGGSSNRTKWAGTESESSLGDYAWYSSNSSSTTHPVGEKRSNQLGLYDMSGNLWEWCADWFDSDYYASSPSSNPTGPRSGAYRVIRGGGWSSGPRDLRVADRYGVSPGYRGGDLGFRLSRTL